MNRALFTTVVIVAIAAILAVRIWHLQTLSGGRATMVALIYNTTDSGTMDAWTEELREAGVPFEWIGQGDLSLLEPTYLRHRFSAIIFPDRLDPAVPGELVATMARYVQDGGTLLVVDDAGTRRADGTYLRSGLFSQLLGLEYVRYTSLRGHAFGHATVRFANVQAARAWHVPLGKLQADALSSYYYGALTYPVRATRPIAPDLHVDASSQFGPVITQHTIGAGNAFYLGLPLGYLRANSDGFPLQMAVDRVIFDSASTPHLVAAPQGVGEIIINWHIDSNSEWAGIPHLLQAGLLRPDIRYDFDVTAGPDRDATGDREGFDACGVGAPYLATIRRYGSIGSHGGWLHNAFAWAIEAHRMPEDRMRSLIDRNDRCLASMTGSAVRDYAAPDGAHPQPATTNVLEGLGIGAYYYTGDTGSAAERALYDNHLVSQGVWAFPIQPFGPYASIAEMRRGGVSPARVEMWLESVMNEAARDHTILLFYSHSYDMQAQEYDAPFNGFLDRLAREQRQGIVRATVMPDASTFLSRLVATQMTFAIDRGHVDVRLHNPQGLRDVAFALPKSWVTPGLQLPPQIRRGRDDARYDYFWVASGDDNLRWTYELGKAN